jgi:hypothetical protein
LFVLVEVLVWVAVFVFVEVPGAQVGFLWDNGIREICVGGVIFSRWEEDVSLGLRGE